jgi:hypothetical protein
MWGSVSSRCASVCWLLLPFLARRFYTEDEVYTILRNVGSNETYARHSSENGVLQSHRPEILILYMEQKVTSLERILSDAERGFNLSAFFSNVY